MSTTAFFGGVHPDGCKDLTQTEYIETAAIPARVVVPLSQHTGAPATPLVQVKSRVRTGQKIGHADSFITAAIHSPVTGTVAAIEDAPHPVLGVGQAFIIDRDENEILDLKPPNRRWDEMTPQEIVEIVREAGIVGLGGAAFPTHVKLTPPNKKTVECLLINGAECEPYLTSDERLMIEQAAELLEGIRILKRATGATEVVLALEDNKHLANKAIDTALAESSAKEVITKKILKTQYPQGSEKQLIQAVTGRQVPSGGLPVDVGVVVQNVGTAIAVYEAVVKGKPLIERVVTVTGDGVNNPGNFLVRIGTSFESLIESAGGFKGEPEKILMGGPMMGITQYTTDVPIIKGTSGILVLTKESAKSHEAGNCIRCSFCIKACPQRLLPQTLAKLAKGEKWFKMKYEYNMLDCIECGCCTYGCPAKIPIVQWIRLGKFRARMLNI
jgi:electron transport complex protein RnfC